MAVVTPPRTADTDERTLDERVAELEALIEEARRRARKRRRRNGAVALAALALAGAAVYAGGDGVRVGEAQSADGGAVPAATLDRGGVWSTPTGPPGFRASIVLHPTKQGSLYLSAGGRVYRSTDGGRSWRSGRPVASRIDALAVDPRRGSILYAGTGDGVLKSTDSGRTWRRSGLAPPPAKRGHARMEGWVYQIAIDPANSRIVYATARERGLSRSTDAGATWLRLPLALRPGALAIHPAAPTTLYAAVALPWTGTNRERSAIMRSTDSGLTWRTVARRDGYTSSLAVDPARPGTIWAVGSAGVLVTRDGGTTWREPGRLPARNLDSVIADPNHSDTLYVSTWKRGLFRSADGGRSWQSFATGLTGVPAIDPGKPGTMYAGDGFGVVKTTDGGATWRRADAGIAASSLNAVAPAASSAATIYAGGSFGLASSGDRGRTWTGLRTNGVASLAVDPRDHRHVLVGAQGIVSSRDGGATWTTVKLAEGYGVKLANGEVRAIAFDAQDPLVVYAGVTYDGDGGAGLIRSSDGGETWRPVPGGPGIGQAFSLAVHPERAGTVYAGGAGGAVAGSTDGGVSWRYSSIPGADATFVESLAVAPSDPDTLYAATEAGLARSVDGGERWRLLPVRGLDVKAVAVDPERAQTVYAGTDGGGVLRSTNGGVSWRPFGTRLPSRSISTLAFDATSTWLYAGTNGAGLTSIRVR